MSYSEIQAFGNFPVLKWFIGTIPELKEFTGY